MEWKRIWHKKTIIMTLVLLFLALLFYAREQYDTGYSYSVFQQSVIRNACRREYRGQNPKTAAKDLEKRAAFHSNMAQYIDYAKMKKEMGTYLGEATKEMIAEFEKKHPHVVKAYRMNTKAYHVERESVKSAIYGELAEQYRHVAGYHARMRTIQKNAQQLNTISIFAGSGSFSDKNIQKTAQDFKTAEKVKTEPGNDEFLTSVFQYKAAYGFALAFGIMLALQMLSERKKGLWPIVYASPKGRVRLAFHRLAVLMGSMMGFVLVLYVGLFVLAGIFYGPEWNWWRDIQSVSQFENIPVPIKEPVFLLLFYLSVVCFVTVSVFLVWTVLLAFTNRIVSAFVLLLLYGISYLLYTGISDQSMFVLLRYLNAYYLLCGANMWSSYLNLNVFGIVVNRMVLLVLLTIVVALAMIAASVVLTAKKYPVQGKKQVPHFLKKILLHIRRIWEWLRSQGMELYKLLVWNRGIWVLVFLGVWGTSGIVEMSFTESRTEQFMNAFYREYSGPVTHKTIQYFHKLEKKIKAVQDEYVKVSVGYQKGTVTREKYLQCQDAYEKIAEKLECCRRIHAEILYAQKAGKNLGYPLWLLNSAGYKRLFDSYGYEMQVKEGVKILLAVVLIMSGMFSTEQKRGMKPLLCSTFYGRETLAERKALAAAIVTVLVMAVVYIPDTISICRLFTVDCLRAPLKSLPFMANSFFEGSILLYLLYVYCLRFAIFYAVAMLVGCLSARYSMEGSVCIGMILILPSVLQVMNIPLLEKLSIAHYSSVFVWQSVENAGVESVLWLLSTGVLLLAAAGIRRFWCGEKKAA